jgi:hypothetical protein
MAKVQSPPSRLSSIAWRSLLLMLAATTTALGVIIFVPGTPRAVIDLAALMLSGTVAAQFGLTQWRTYRGDMSAWLFLLSMLSAFIGGAGAVMAALTNG